MPVEMVYYADMTHDEAATYMGIPRRTFSWRLNQTLIKIRKFLK